MINYFKLTTYLLGIMKGRFSIRIYKYLIFSVMSMTLVIGSDVIAESLDAEQELKISEIQETSNNIIFSEEEIFDLGFIPYFVSEPLFDDNLVTSFDIQDTTYPILEIQENTVNFKYSFDTNFSHPTKMTVLFLYDGEFLQLNNQDDYENYISLGNDGQEYNYQYDFEFINVNDDYSYSDITVLSHLKDDDIVTFPSHLYLTNGEDFSNNPHYDTQDYSNDSLVDSHLEDSNQEIPELSPDNKDNLPINEDSSSIIISQSSNEEIKQDIIIYDSEGTIYQKELISYQPGKNIEITLNEDVIENIDSKSLYLLIEMYLNSDNLDMIPKDIPYVKHSQSYKIN